ncbi:hypothetical protein [Paramagnetospirillum magneticum]|nr:hypothetical protein [Paramagnetospirillum magneticum]
MSDKPMRDQDLSRTLFSDTPDQAAAALARQALDRLDGQGPAWLDELTQAPPKAPPALVEAALAKARPSPPRRLWLWSGALAAAALAGLLVIRAEPPPVTVVEPVAPPSPAAPKGLVNAVQETVMPAKPITAAIATTPRIRETLAAHLAQPGEATRTALLGALRDSGVRLDLSPDVTALQVGVKPPLPPRLTVTWTARAASSSRREDDLHARGYRPDPFLLISID